MNRGKIQKKFRMKTTKQLARELGLLRERKLSITSGEANRKQKSCQMFSYLVVIDFESTCWERDKTKTQEIIEFPAVLLSTRTGQIESEFHYYVQPQEHPTLSSFCQQLTGISQDQVDNGIPLSLCLRKFSHWLHKLSQDFQVCLAGERAANTGDASLKLAAIVTWSDWDLGVCLHYELRRKQIPKALCFNQWIDLRATYTKFYGRKPKGLNGALQDVGIRFEGREHSGLHDSRNTATLAWRMIQDGCIMAITKSLANAAASSSACLQAQALPPRTGRTRTGRTPKKKTPQKPTAADAEELVPGGGDTAAICCPKDCNSGSPDFTRQSNPTWNNRAVTAGLRVRNQNLPQLLHCVDKNTKHLQSSQKRPASFTPEKSSRLKCLRLSATCSIVSDLASNRGWTAPRNKRLTGSSSVHDASTPRKLQPDAAQASPYSSTTASKQTKELSILPATSSTTPSISIGAPFKKPSQCSAPASTPATHFEGCSRTKLHNSKIPLATTVSTLRRPCVVPSTVTFLNLMGPRRSVPSTVTFLNQTGPGCSVPISSSGIQSCSTAVAQTRRTSSPPQQHLLPDRPACKAGSSFHTPPLLQGPASGRYDAALFRTPRDPPRTSACAMKATPPLCRCGRRAKRRRVQTPGPNTGRCFFSCIKGTPNSANPKTSGCGFFQWEQASAIASAAHASPVIRQVYGGHGAGLAASVTLRLKAPASLAGHRTVGLSSLRAKSLR